MNRTIEKLLYIIEDRRSWMHIKMSKQDLIDFEKESLTGLIMARCPIWCIYQGNEESIDYIFRDIKEGTIFSTHRSHYHYLLCGGSPDDLENKILNGKSMFVFDRKLNFSAHP